MLDSSMAPHAQIHGRSDINRTGSGKINSTQEVITEAARKFGNGVSACRCDQLQILPASPGNLIVPLSRFFISTTVYSRFLMRFFFVYFLSFLFYLFFFLIII